MGVGSFTEDSAVFKVLLGLLALAFSLLLIELLCEVGWCFPPGRIVCILPVVQ